MRMVLTSPGLDPDRRPGHRQDPHPAGRPDAGPGQAAALPARRPDRARRQADEEATGQPAGTLHRVLELRPGGQADAWTGQPAGGRPGRRR